MGVVARGSHRARRPKRKERSFWRELPFLAVIALGLALVIRAFVIQAFYIPSESMENTLLTDDRVLVNKLAYRVGGIARGDVVVFTGEGAWDQQGQEKDYIKRVIGVGGDAVACCDKKGRLSVNGIPLEELDYLFQGDRPSMKWFKALVPEGHIWVMGDHRGVSVDSRGHPGSPGGGAIPETNVVGRAFVVVWPLTRWATLTVPGTFEQPGLLAKRTAPLIPDPIAVAVPLPVLLLWRRRVGGHADGSII